MRAMGVLNRLLVYALIFLLPLAAIARLLVICGGPDEPPMVDSDGDNLSDTLELQYFGTLDAPMDEDPDGDGLTNGDELAAALNPFACDTDGDGVADADDPFPAACPDQDNDGLPDDWERRHFGDLRYDANDDPDGDSLTNAAELAAATDPAHANQPDTTNTLNLNVYTPANMRTE